MKHFTAISRGLILAFLGVVLAGCGEQDSAPEWEISFSPSVEDIDNFLEGDEPYTQPRTLAAVLPVSSGYQLFYRTDTAGSKAWGWKMVASTNEASDFLNRTGDYAGVPIADALMAYNHAGEIYLFYREIDEKASWFTMSAENPAEIQDVLDGVAPYRVPRTLSIGGSGTNNIVMIYRDDSVGKGGWGWTIVASTDEAYDLLNGFGSYDAPVQDARIVAAGDGRLCIFYRR